jgi:CRISPR-associated protein Cas2
MKGRDGEGRDSHIGTGISQRERHGGHVGDENLYIVTYDISAPARWRKVFRIMEGYGEWVQLSVFQCRLSRRRQIELKRALDEVINHAEDHIIIIDVGPPAMNRPRVESLGKPFTVVARGPVIV